MRTRHLTALGIAIAAALFVSATAGHAAQTSEACLAKKRQTEGKFEQCRAIEDAKALQGKASDLAKCSIKFQEKIAAVSEKASAAGIQCRFVDNGNGTVTDYDTGLQWEKKTSPGGGATDPHDVDNTYTWNTVVGGTVPNGTAFTDFLGRLNNCSFANGIVLNSAGFAFHCDWRLPTLAELESIRLEAPCGGSCIDPIFGPNLAGVADAYWTATTDTNSSSSAWIVPFAGGSGAENKANDNSVRAVRGGL